MVHDSLIEIGTTEMGISGCGDNLEHSSIDGQDGHIEGTTTQIEDKNVLLTLLLIETVGDGGGCRFIENTDDIQTGNSTSILSGLSLGIIEVSWDGNDCVNDLLTQVLFGDLLHLGQDLSRNFLRGEDLSLTVDIGYPDVWLAVLIDNLIGKEFPIVLNSLIGKTSTDESLYVVEGTGRIDGGLILGRFSDQEFLIGEGHNRGSNTISELVGNDFHM